MDIDFVHTPGYRGNRRRPGRLARLAAVVLLTVAVAFG